MNTARIRAINHERLGRWVARLTSAHATGAFLVGFGHDHAAGEVTICACEDFTDETLLAMLRAAVELLAKKVGAQ